MKGYVKDTGRAHLLDAHVPATLDVEQPGRVGGVGVNVAEARGHAALQVPHTILEPGGGRLLVCVCVCVS